MNNYNYTSVFFKGAAFQFSVFEQNVSIPVSRFETDYYEKWQIPYMLLENHIGAAVRDALNVFKSDHPDINIELISLSVAESGNTLMIVEATRNDDTIRLFPQLVNAHGSMNYGAGYDSRPSWVHWGLWIPKTKVEGKLFTGSFGGLFGMYPTVQQLMYEFDRYVGDWARASLIFLPGESEYSYSLGEQATVSSVVYDSYRDLPGIESVYNQQATELEWGIQISVKYTMVGDTSGKNTTSYLSQIIQRFSRASHGVGVSTAGWCTMIPRVNSSFPDSDSEGENVVVVPVPEVGEDVSPTEPPIVNDDVDFVIEPDMQDTTPDVVSPGDVGVPEDWFTTVTEEVKGLSKRALYTIGAVAVFLLLM